MLNPIDIPPLQTPIAAPGFVDFSRNAPWSSWFQQIGRALSEFTTIIPITAAHLVVANDAQGILLCTGTFTVTLPARNAAGDSYFVFNNGAGVITLAGTINGNAAGYQLINRYQYVRVVSLGTSWIVVANN